MSQKNRAKVQMNFASGEPISTWERFSMTDNFADPLQRLEFVVRPPRERIDEHREKLAKGQLVTLLVNNISQGGFLIQTVTTQIDNDNGVVFTITCNTPLITMYQASVDPDLSFHSKTDIPIEDVIKKAFARYLNPLVLSSDTTKHVDAISGKPRSKKGQHVATNRLKYQDAQAQDGETVYQFAARLITRLGLCLRMQFDGSLMLQAPDYEQAPSYTVIQTFGSAIPGADRMLSGIEVIDTNDNQFSECVVRGLQQDREGSKQTRRPKSNVASTDLSSKRPPYSATGAPAYKPLILTDKNSRDVERCKSTGKLALGIRAKEAFQVRCEVDGFLTADGAIWTVDTMGRVVVQAAGLDETMWLLERTLIQDREGGQKARLTFIPKGALVLGEVPS